MSHGPSTRDPGKYGVLRGHAVCADASAYEPDGTRVNPATVGGPGHAMCTCGLVSGDVFRTTTERKAWHRAHKDEIRQALHDAEVSLALLEEAYVVDTYERFVEGASRGERAG